MHSLLFLEAEGGCITWLNGKGWVCDLNCGYLLGLESVGMAL